MFNVPSKTGQSAALRGGDSNVNLEKEHRVLKVSNEALLIYI